MTVPLETRRLTLRPFTESDVDLLVELDSDPAVMRYLNGGRPTPRDEAEETIGRLLREYERFPGLGRFVALQRSTGDFVGWFALGVDAAPDEAELGYRLRRPYWGKGYATEGSRALVAKAFTDLGVQRITATTMTVNAASRRVMGKVGLDYVRTFHLAWPEIIEGTEFGDVEYAVDRATWLAAPHR